MCCDRSPLIKGCGFLHEASPLAGNRSSDRMRRREAQTGVAEDRADGARASKEEGFMAQRKVVTFVLFLPRLLCSLNTNTFPLLHTRIQIRVGYLSRFFLIDLRLSGALKG